MELFYSWVRNIILFSLLASIVLEIIPSENYKNYLQLFIGFLLLFLVIEPIIDFVGAGQNLKFGEIERFFPVDLKELGEDSRKLKEKSEERRKESYEAEIEKQLRGILEAEDYKLISEKVKVRMEEENLGEIDEIELVLEARQSENKVLQTGGFLNQEGRIETQVKQIVRDFYQLSEAQINVSVRESLDGK